MPRLNLCGRRVNAASDDFVCPGLTSSLLRVLWIATCSALLSILVPGWTSGDGANESRADCLGTVVAYLSASLWTSAIGLILDLLITRTSWLGTPLDESSRKRMPSFLGVRIGWCVVDVVIAGLGVAAVHWAPNGCAPGVVNPPLQHSLMVAAVISLVVTTAFASSMIGLFACALRSERVRAIDKREGCRDAAAVIDEVEPASGAGPGAGAGSPTLSSRAIDGYVLDEHDEELVESAHAWARRCRGFAWCCRGVAAADTSFEVVGTVLAGIFERLEPLNLTASDVAAALALVRSQQKGEERRMVAALLQEQSAKVSAAGAATAVDGSDVAIEMTAPGTGAGLPSGRADGNCSGEAAALPAATRPGSSSHSAMAGATSAAGFLAVPTRSPESAGSTVSNAASESGGVPGAGSSAALGTGLLASHRLGRHQMTAPHSSTPRSSGSLPALSLRGLQQQVMSAIGSHRLVPTDVTRTRQYAVDQTGTAAVDFSDPQQALALREAAHFSSFAVGAYGWPLFAYMHPASFCCRLPAAWCHQKVVDSGDARRERLMLKNAGLAPGPDRSGTGLPKDTAAPVDARHGAHGSLPSSSDMFHRDHYRDVITGGTGTGLGSHGDPCGCHEAALRHSLTRAIQTDGVTWPWSGAQSGPGLSGSLAAPDTNQQSAAVPSTSHPAQDHDGDRRGGQPLLLAGGSVDVAILTTPERAQQAAADRQQQLQPSEPSAPSPKVSQSTASVPKAASADFHRRHLLHTSYTNAFFSVPWYVAIDATGCATGAGSGVASGCRSALESTSAAGPVSASSPPSVGAATLVICCRGTLSPEDLITDGLALPLCLSHDPDGHAILDAIQRQMDWTVPSAGAASQRFATSESGRGAAALTTRGEAGTGSSFGQPPPGRPPVAPTTAFRSESHQRHSRHASQPDTNPQLDARRASRAISVHPRRAYVHAGMWQAAKAVRDQLLEKGLLQSVWRPAVGANSAEGRPVVDQQQDGPGLMQRATGDVVNAETKHVSASSDRLLLPWTYCLPLPAPSRVAGSAMPAAADDDIGPGKSTVATTVTGAALTESSSMRPGPTPAQQARRPLASSSTSLLQPYLRKPQPRQPHPPSHHAHVATKLMSMVARDFDPAPSQESGVDADVKTSDNGAEPEHSVQTTISVLSVSQSAPHTSDHGGAPVVSTPPPGALQAQQLEPEALTGPHSLHGVQLTLGRISSDTETTSSRGPDARVARGAGIERKNNDGHPTSAAEQSASHKTSAAAPLSPAPVGNLNLVVCGHSLGAGVATLLALQLKPYFPHLKCYAFSPPGALASPALGRLMEPFVTSVVIGKDLVPRMTLPSLIRLGDDMIDVLRRAKVSKTTIMASARYGDPQWPGSIICQSLCGVKRFDAVELLRLHTPDGSSDSTVIRVDDADTEAARAVVAADAGGPAAIAPEAGPAGTRRMPGADRDGTSSVAAPSTTRRPSSIRPPNAQRQHQPPAASEPRRHSFSALIASRRVLFSRRMQVAGRTLLMMKIRRDAVDWPTYFLGALFSLCGIFKFGYQFGAAVASIFCFCFRRVKTRYTPRWVIDPGQGLNGPDTATGWDDDGDDRRSRHHQTHHGRRQPSAATSASPSPGPFASILISPYMVSDHMPDKVERVLREAVQGMGDG